jgi:hypothetical protein
MLQVNDIASQGIGSNDSSNKLSNQINKHEVSQQLNSSKHSNSSRASRQKPKRRMVKSYHATNNEKPQNKSPLTAEDSEKVVYSLAQ